MDGELSALRKLAIGLLWPLVLFASGPAHSEDLSPASTGGMIEMGFEGSPNWTVDIITYDPTTNRADFDNRENITGETVWFYADPKLTRFRFEAVAPGHYVVGLLHADVGRRRFYSCLSPTTVAFEVKPGQVTYIGTFGAQDERGAYRLPDDMPAAQTALASEYPKGTAPLVPAERSDVTPEIQSRRAYACATHGAFRQVPKP